jgi:hypothetical protein
VVAELNINLATDLMEITKEIKYGDSVKTRQQFCIK